MSEAALGTRSDSAVSERRGAVRLVVDTFEWERVQLTIGGHVVVPEGTVFTAEGCELHVQEQATGERILIGEATVEAGRFSLRFNAMQVDNQYPLRSGRWELSARCDDGSELPVLMHHPFALQLEGYGGLFDVAGGRYWVMPGHDPNSGTCHIAVNYGRGLSALVATALNPLPSEMVRRFRRIVRSIRTAIFVGIYSATRALVKRNGRRVLFTSDSRSELSGNLLHIYDRMRERELDRDYRLMQMFKPSINVKRKFSDKFIFPYYLGIADVIVIDDFHPMIYKIDLPEDVRLIQVWHASGAFKTVGYSRIGKPGGPSPFSAAHKNYTHAIVSSAHDIPFYAEAFGIPESRVVPTGIPRMDVFFDEDYRQRTVESVTASLPAIEGKSVILFAPTFRGRGPSDAYYNYEELDLPTFYRLCEEIDAVVLFKMHPFVLEPLQIPAEFQDRFIDTTSSREINDLLFVADLVVTDYSSLVFEYSTLGRPMLFFAYDLEDYISSRDFYEEFTRFVPGKIVRTFDELLQAVRVKDFEAEKVECFAKQHVAHLDADSTDRVIDSLILGHDAP